MSKRRVTAIVAIAGMLDICLAGGCHSPGHRCCWQRDRECGKSHVCDTQGTVVAGPTALADAYDAPGTDPVPGAVTNNPTPSLGNIERELPSTELPPTAELKKDDPVQLPVDIGKSESQPGELSPAVTEPQPSLPGKVTEPAPGKEPVVLDPEPTVEPKSDTARVNPNPEATPADDLLGVLNKLGVIVKFDRSLDPFGDKETIDAVVGLDLSSAQVTDADLKLFAGMKNLREIDLTGTPVTDTGLKELRTLTELDLLWLNGTKVTDAGLESLADMKKLKSLGLANTSISDEGIKRVAGMKELEYLLLAQSKVSDEGLLHLRGLTHLKGLSLMGSQVTIEGVKRLREALPDCQIVFNSKKEQSSLPLFQRRPFGWFPHLIASKRTAKTSEMADETSSDDTGKVVISDMHPQTEPNEFTEEGVRDESSSEPAESTKSLADAGQRAISQGRWDEAISKLTPALEAAPDNVQIRYQLAVSLGRAGKIDEALPHFVASVGEAEAHYNLGVILYEAGDLEASEQQLLKALRIKPELTVAREQLEEIHRELRVAEEPVRQTGAYFQRMTFGR